MRATEEHLRELLIGGLEGNESAYRAFLVETSAHLRAFFRRRLTRMPDYVEDLVQETLLALHNQRHTYDASQPLTAWVHAIARYKMIDWLRRRGAGDALTDTLDDDLEVFARADTEASDAHRDLHKLLERLPDSQRLPIVYTKLEGLSVLEAARRASMSVSAVKVGVHRGLKALAAMIRNET